jgi:hypothetical protein
MDTLYRPTEEVREHARQSALAGRPVFANPHLGADADVWFDAYREVPEEQRGSQPDARPKPRRVRAKRKQSGLPKLHLKGSTPRPISKLSATEIASRIAYHERVLAESTSADRRVRSERQLARLRIAVPASPARTPRPWSER